MTVVEMHYDFKLKLDKVASQAKEDFNRAEIDWLLNEGQNLFIKRRYGHLNKYNFGFEGNQKRIHDLANLVIKSPQRQPLITPTSVGGTLEVPVSSLAFPLLLFLRARIKVNASTCTDKWARIVETEHDDLDSVLDDPFNNPSTKELPGTFGLSSATVDNHSLYIYPGSVSDLGDVAVDYIKVPDPIRYGGYVYIDATTPLLNNCELAPHTHSEIVDIAVEIASGVIEHPNYVQLKAHKAFDND